jgi:hypothetical protein
MASNMMPLRKSFRKMPNTLSIPEDEPRTPIQLPNTLSIPEDEPRTPIQLPNTLSIPEDEPRTPVRNMESPDYNAILQTPETPKEYPPPTPRKESQAHGLIWEKDILSNSFRVSPGTLSSRKQNAIFDLEGIHNKLAKGVNLAIKVSGSNTINMGDCRRVFKSVSSNIPIHLVVIQYKQIGNKKKVYKITEFDITKAKELLFGDMKLVDLEKLDKAIKDLPKCITPQASNKKTLRLMRNEIHSSETIKKKIRLDIKCTKKQRRLQFSIKNWAKFIEDNPGRVILESHTNKFRKGYIRPELLSDTRKRTEKIPQVILEENNIEIQPGVSIDMVEE